MSVRTGIDVLQAERRRLVRGRRIGVLCHAASVDSRLAHVLDVVVGCGGELKAIFGPEHGVAGAAQDMVGVDGGGSGLFDVPVHSLYGTSEGSLRPRPALLEGLDAVVVDLQDVGSRYYTYVWTAAMMVEACAARGIEVIVLDRPNPLGGEVVEGPGIAEGYNSFVGYWDVPVRHGLTIGELLRLVAAETGTDDVVTTVPVEGWQPERGLDQQGLPWVLPSPNMPTIDSAWVYPGACLVEGTELSEGRGTTRPFEICGAPFVQGRRLVRALDSERLSGVAWRATTFEPTFQKFAGRSCGGVQLYVTDRSCFAPLRTGVALLSTLWRLWPEDCLWRDRAYEFVTDRPAIDLLAGGPWLRGGIEAGVGLDELCATWGPDERAFRERRAPHLLYPRAGQ